MQNTRYMMQALQLAEKGRGKVSPNPMVGAVIVKDNKVIGQGYHEEYGGPHAEVNAIKNATESVVGATMYVTLEPCSHFGLTPPCAQLLIDSGISKVYIAAKDPNPLVNGKGIAMLKEAGIEVDQGILDEMSERLNEGFIKKVTKNKPLYTGKIAMSLDGKIATKIGDSKWITNENTRKFGHSLRGKNDAILVGIGTVLADDPQLNCRSAKARFQPDCLILDTNGRTPVDAKVFMEKARRVHIFVGENCAKERITNLEKAGAFVHVIKQEEHICLDAVNEKICELGYNTVLIEGGSVVNAAFIEAKLTDKLWVFIGDKLMCSQDAISALNGEGISYINESLKVKFKEVSMADNNIYLLAEIVED